MIVDRVIKMAESDLIANGVWILAKAGVPGATDGVGIAGKGSLCSDVTNGILYINTGTIAAPTWTKVGTQT